MIRRPPRSPLFPYPPLFRSDPASSSAGAPLAGPVHRSACRLCHGRDYRQRGQLRGRLGNRFSHGRPLQPSHQNRSMIMTLKSILALSLVAFTFPVSLWAEDAHHPQPTKEVIPETTAAPTEASAMGRMEMMPDMMRMMQDMGDPTRHVEGRIAFLHAELAITADQQTAWSPFADAL